MSRDMSTGIDRDESLRLLLSHRAMLMGYIGMIVRDSHTAEDVFQEVAIIVVEKARTLANREDFPRWARKIARFKALKAVHSRVSAPSIVDESLLDLLEEDWASDDQAEPAPSSEALQHCLGALTPYARQLIELRYGKSLTGKALAESLGQPVNTIYVALSRTYRALAACVRTRLSREGLAYE